MKQFHGDLGEKVYKESKRKRGESGKANIWTYVYYIQINDEMATFEKIV